jgi:hypothetical protein
LTLKISTLSFYCFFSKSEKGDKLAWVHRYYWELSWESQPQREQEWGQRAEGWLEQEILLVEQSAELRKLDEEPE